MFLFLRLQEQDWPEMSVSDWTKGKRAYEASVWLWWGIWVVTYWLNCYLCYERHVFFALICLSVGLSVCLSAVLLKKLRLNYFGEIFGKCRLAQETAK